MQQGKKSILLFSQAMELGGVERSLLGLLGAVDYERFEVDVFLMRHCGELLPYLDPRARLLPELPEYAALAVPMASLLRRGQLRVLRRRLAGRRAARRFDRKCPPGVPAITALTYSHKYTLPAMPMISQKTYNLAISFLTPHYFVRERVKAKKYAAWIHTDYTALWFDRAAELAMWRGYDAICGVSAETSAGFCAVFPELAACVRTVENILPQALIARQAQEPAENWPPPYLSLRGAQNAPWQSHGTQPENPNALDAQQPPATTTPAAITAPTPDLSLRGAQNAPWQSLGTQPEAVEDGSARRCAPQNGRDELRLLSVGRFCRAKNFDNVPDICRRILADGLNITWYLIGYGGDEALIRQRIAEAGMEQHVILLGKKSNPYPYLRACDLYVQPSRYEGKAVTVREAQLLCKPVVITNYATSASQLDDGVDGVIVPMDNAGCAAAIAALLRDPEKMHRLSTACTRRDYTNRAEIEKLYALMEDNA